LDLRQPRVPGRLILVVLALAGTASAQVAASDGDLRQYLVDQAFRRAALERSLATRKTQYARERLQRYASGDAVDWDLRPEWNPPAAPLGETSHTLVLSDRPRRLDRATLTRLGADAFFRYPAQLAPYLPEAGVDHAVKVVMPDGVGWALTCASCHTRRVGGKELIGAGSSLDLGVLMNREAPNAPLAQARAAWGPGRVDVSSDDGDDPQRIPDLRPLRFTSHLQHGAAVIQHDEVALAIRIETLIITAHGGAIRPPRQVALGLALYIWSLADTLPPVAAPSAVFTQRCAGCHRPPTFSGPPIDAALAHADPAHALRSERSHGVYRVPSLRGVGSRGALLHDGSAADLRALLARFPGRFDRNALIAYLQGL